MIISCPNCSTTYHVDNAILGLQGKSVRCSKCEQQWHQLPVQSAPVRQPLALNVSQPDATSGTIEPGLLQAQIQAQLNAMVAMGQIPQLPHSQSTNPVSQNANQSDLASEPDPDINKESNSEPERNQEVETEDPPTKEELDEMFGEDEPETFGSLVEDSKDTNEEEAEGIKNLDDIPEPDPIPESLMSMDSFDEDDDDEDYDEEDDDDTSSGKSIGLIIGIFSLVLIVGIALGGFFYRDLVQEIIPQTKPIYKIIGLGENLGAGLAIEDVRSQREQNEGNDTLAVSGKVVNISKKIRKIPEIRISLFNADKKEINFIKVTPENSEIQPGEKLDFNGTLPVPDATAKKLEVTFTESKE